VTPPDRSGIGWKWVWGVFSRSFGVVLPLNRWNLWKPQQNH